VASQEFALSENLTLLPRVSFVGRSILVILDSFNLVLLSYIVNGKRSIMSHAPAWGRHHPFRLDLYFRAEEFQGRHHYDWWRYFYQ
jgi:hypothetical protein